MLSEALEREEVVTHPFVIGELACGSIARRREVLDLLTHLPSANAASDEEVLLFIEQRRLMGRGIGYIDAHLLAAASLTPGVRVWTRDKPLATVAAHLRLDLMNG